MRQLANARIAHRNGKISLPCANLTAPNFYAASIFAGPAGRAAFIGNGLRGSRGDDDLCKVGSQLAKMANIKRVDSLASCLPGRLEMKHIVDTTPNPSGLCTGVNGVGTVRGAPMKDFKALKNSIGQHLRRFLRKDSRRERRAGHDGIHLREPLRQHNSRQPTYITLDDSCWFSQHIVWRMPFLMAILF